MTSAEQTEAVPKYRVIYNALLEALKNGEYEAGKKLPSENELVEQFGASRPTVGRALAQLENEGLIVRRAGSGTFARIPNRQDTFIFGLLIPGLGATEIFEPICRGISMARVGGHHDLLWGPTLSPAASPEAQVEELCKYYIRRGVNGIFFAPLELMGGKDEVNRRITTAFDEAGIPVVLLDRDICEFPQRSRFDLVGINNHRAGFVITQHVMDAGARRIVFFARPNSASTVSARALGCSEAVRQANDASLEVTTHIGDPSDSAEVRKLIDRFRPDAIVCANDITAGQIMTSLNALGIRVPSEIKVTGMDDIRYAQMLQTPLTTIQQPCLDIGVAALSTMLDRASHPNMPARDVFIDFKLVIRESTKS
jgi:DNA-binding LacI/PurR family transcriptional regulator